MTWLFPAVPLNPLVQEEVLEQLIMAILICPGWTGATWWPQLVKLRTNGSNPSASGSGLPQVSQGEQGGAPQLGSTLCFSHQRKRVEPGVDNPEVLNEEELAFLVDHIRKGTRGTYKSGWRRFKTLCESKGINPQ